MTRVSSHVCIYVHMWPLVVWYDVREKQRLKNLTWDMTHYHKVEENKEVEMALEPSATLQKRAGK